MSQLFLSPEIEEGNIEYKRCLKDFPDIHRLEELKSQMIWRVKEGGGEAIYYLGINDDGTFYEWTTDEKEETIKVLKKVVLMANLKIVKIIKKEYSINNYYMEVIIREKNELFPEKRILLLGPSGVGKTTFIANIIKDKIDQPNKEARMYMLNHKHEIIQKKTSSFNYWSYVHNKIKWVFIEAPGDNKYLKTRNKIILSFGSTIDIALIFDFKDSDWNQKNLYLSYLNKMNIPYINIDLYSSNSYTN